MIICGLNKTTLLDYPEHVAATIFTGSCNFRCPFCQNSGLVLSPSLQQQYSETEILSFLKKRKNVLSGICISGGEPTLQPDLPDFISQVKALGYSVKLDTNGYQPAAMKSLLANKLIDYVAMDIKNSSEKYALTAGLPSLDFSLIQESIALLMESNIPYEFRTTIVKELHSESDILSIGQLISGAKAYYLQSYQDSAEVLSPGYHAHEKEQLIHFQNMLLPYVPNTFLRGV